MDTYKIVRYYKDDERKPTTTHRGLTLEEAKNHCRDTKTRKVVRSGTIAWFEGYVKE